VHDDASSVTPEHEVGIAVRRGRELAGLSQAELAAAMTEHEFPFTQQMVAKVEAGRRELRLREAAVLCRILRIPVSDLTRRGPEGDQAWRLMENVRAVYRSHADLIHMITALRRYQGQLRQSIESAEKSAGGSLALEIEAGRAALAETEGQIRETEDGIAYAEGKWGLVDRGRHGQRRILERVRHDGPEAGRDAGPPSPEEAQA
jgi:transcriptional regulator with XRE-family HTH domain